MAQSKSTWPSVDRLAHNDIVGLDDAGPCDPVVWAALIRGVAQAVIHALCAGIRSEDGKHRLVDLTCARRILDEMDETGTEALSAQALMEMDFVDVDVGRVVVGEHEGGEAENVAVAAGVGSRARAQQKIDHVAVEHLVPLVARVPANARCTIVVARRLLDEAQAGLELGVGEVESRRNQVERDGTWPLRCLVCLQVHVLTQHSLQRVHAREARVHGGKLAS
jgi:hypothetical protein